MQTIKKFNTYRKLRLSNAVIATLIFAAGGSILTYTSFAAEEQIVGEWQVLCDVNHLLTDDPIVFPGGPGKSHMHSFYGNETTNAHTTTESLMANRSTCGRNMETTDRSGYWVPSMYIKNPDGSIRLAPTGEQIAFIYYERLGGTAGQKVLPFPNGLRMIAGDAAATSPQPKSVVYWTCGGGGPETSYIPHCPEAGQIPHATLMFPNCWNGRDLDSPDHKSHMAYYSTPGTCPASHPVSLPRLKFELDYYGVTGGTDHILASGGQYSMHGDFFAAWDVRVQNALVSECLNTPRPCIGIERQGDRIIKPSYDPDPIPPIMLANFSSQPQTVGALPAIAPPAPAQAPRPVTPPAAKPVAPNSSASAPPSSGSPHHETTPEAHTAAHGAAVNARYSASDAARQIAAEQNADRPKLVAIVTGAVVLLGAIAGIVLLRRRRRTASGLKN